MTEGDRFQVRVNDEQMARINIEASAALAESIDLYRRTTTSSPSTRY